MSAYLDELVLTGVAEGRKLRLVPLRCQLQSASNEIWRVMMMRRELDLGANKVAEAHAAQSSLHEPFLGAPLEQLVVHHLGRALLATSHANHVNCTFNKPPRRPGSHARTSQAAPTARRPSAMPCWRWSWTPRL